MFTVCYIALYLRFLQLTTTPATSKTPIPAKPIPAVIPDFG